MTTTLATFKSQLAALTVAGVTRKYTYHPLGLSTADLPASFPARNEYGTEYAGGGEWASTCDGTSTTHRGRLIVAVEAENQSRVNEIDDAVTAMQDALMAAALAWDGPAHLESVNTSAIILPIGESRFFCAVLDVTAMYLD